MDKRGSSLWHRPPSGAGRKSGGGVSRSYQHVLSKLSSSDRRWRPIIFCDFDGTISQIDLTDVILERFAAPSWRDIEEEWLNGLIGSRECLERQMALTKVCQGELDALIDSVPFDTEFSRFYQFVRKRNIPFYILSDGFDYVIRRVLKRVGLEGEFPIGVRLFSNSLRVESDRLTVSFNREFVPCDHGCAVCKAAILRRLNTGYYPVITIGDGLSDQFAAEEADLVFAKDQLADYCRDRGIPYLEFEAFGEVEHAIRALMVACLRRRRYRALVAEPT